MENLKKENLDIVVITIDSGHYIEKFEKAGIRVINLSLKGLVNPLIFFKLSNILKKIRPDIVHTHLLKADFYGRLTAKFLKIPLVFSTCHNDSTTHNLRRTDAKNFFDFVDNWVIDYTNSYIIAISEKVKEYLLHRKNEKISNRITVVYNGINIKKEHYILNNEEIKYFKNSLGLHEEDFVIAIVGRLEKQKGHIEFLSCCADVIKKNNLKILIVGSGTQKINIENCVKAEKIENNIIFTGFKEDTEKYFEISNLVAVPSIWEGFGIVACEGMIKGKIVLAANVGGLPEIIDDGVDGFLYNHSELKDKLEFIVKKYAELSNMKRNAREKIKSKFDIQKNSLLYYSEYTKRSVME
ncbi:MAG: glycosyltransferase [Bacteroidetes bacterium]|nr:glycosyltransferase [Bacteroidota bacterium]